MTFSILGRCARTGMMGMAISSSSPAVAARCAHGRAGVGMVATQNITDPRLGPQGLALLASGLTAEAALTALLDGYAFAAYRQVLVLDAAGNAATHSGEHTLGIHGAAKGRDCVAGGNLLANDAVPTAMADVFAASAANANAHLGDRLVAALAAGFAAGGEAGPVHSAGLLIVRDVAWPVADLRVDWHDNSPIGTLASLWARYKPQLDDYVTRALDPTRAPGFGVPGDSR